MTKRLKYREDLIGQRFERWTVLARAPNRRSRSGTEPMWHCRCACGAVRPVRGFSLRHGVSRSCGCLANDLRPTWQRTHGEAGKNKTPEFIIWCGIRARCLRRANAAYRDYGGRGIRVCRRWHKYENFLADMGRRPPRMTLDRIDNDGDYEPGNCRWASMRTQANNRRSNRMIVTSDGTHRTLAELQREMGVTEKTTRYYLNKLGPDRAVEYLRTYTGRPVITHCPHGHEYSAENTRLYHGRRFCKECDRAKHRRRSAAARAQMSPA